MSLPVPAAMMPSGIAGAGAQVGPEVHHAVTARDDDPVHRTCGDGRAALLHGAAGVGGAEVEDVDPRGPQQGERLGADPGPGVPARGGVDDETQARHGGNASPPASGVGVGADSAVIRGRNSGKIVDVTTLFETFCRAPPPAPRGAARPRRGHRPRAGRRGAPRPGRRAVRRAGRLRLGRRDGVSTSRSPRWSAPSGWSCSPTRSASSRAPTSSPRCDAAGRRCSSWPAPSPWSARSPSSSDGALSLEPGTVAGAYAGALTNTPALAAASARAADPAAPTIGYSITYLGGVIVMLVVAAWSLRRPGARAAPRGDRPRHRARRGRRADDRGRCSPAAHDGEIGVSRLKHAHAANPTIVPAGHRDDRPQRPRHRRRPARRPRRRRRSGWATCPRTTSSRTGTTSTSAASPCRTSRSSATPSASSTSTTKFGATVSRVRRGDVDLVAHDTFVLAMGDRLRVIAPRDRMAEVGEYLGDSDRGMSDINVGGLALGLAVGMAIGLVHVPTPGGGFTIGAAAGTLLVGLVFGRLGRVGPVITSMSNGAAHALSALGMVTFLAYAGVRAGRSISEALASDCRVARRRARARAHRLQRRPARARACTSCARMSWLETAGALAGAQTQPAILAYVNDQTGYDTRIGVAYALVYPVAMITKIIVAQVLAGPRLTRSPAAGWSVAATARVGADRRVRGRRPRCRRRRASRGAPSPCACRGCGRRTRPRSRAPSAVRRRRTS